MDDASTGLSRNLGANVAGLRAKRGMSQLALAKLAGVPRSTIAHLESGAGNPSLSNLARLAAGLNVGLDELLSRPRPLCQLVKASAVPRVTRSQGRAFVHKLLPDPIPGMEMDRMEIEPAGRLGGVPHTAGTKEYLTVIRGSIEVIVSGERYRVERGDVFAFPGDLAHSYRNVGEGRALAFSIVILAPSVLLRESRAT